MPELSNEIWLMILLHLDDYCDLKNCVHVSKQLRLITGCADFDKILFRSKTVISSHDKFNMADLRLHPALERVFLRCGDRIEEVGFVLYKKKGQSGVSTAQSETELIPLEDIPVANETVTQPAVTRVYLKGRKYAVNNKDGVTILQVFNVLCDLETQCVVGPKAHFLRDLSNPRLDSSNSLYLQDSWSRSAFTV